jgi:hypothetical protein
VIRGKVVEVVPSTAGWREVQVEGLDHPILVHQNWFNENGELKPGDEVEYDPVMQGARNFSRAPKEASLE